MNIWVLFPLALTICYALEVPPTNKKSIPGQLVTVNSNHIDQGSPRSRHHEVYTMTSHRSDHNPLKKGLNSAEITFGFRAVSKKRTMNGLCRKLIQIKSSPPPSPESLKTYYKISQQIKKHEGGMRIQYLACLVSQITGHLQDSTTVEQILTLRSGQSFRELGGKFITKALEVLQDASLEPRERLWTLGVLSWFKHNLAKSYRPELRDFRTGYQVTQGEAELSLLSGQMEALEVEVNRMWDPKNSSKDLEILDMTLKEPLERIRMLRAFQIHIMETDSKFVTSTSLAKIHDDFLRLPVPLKVLESQKLIQNIKKLMLKRFTTVEAKQVGVKDRHPAVELELAYHIWIRHLHMFQGDDIDGGSLTLNLKEILSNLHRDRINAQCQLKCFDSFHKNDPSREHIVERINFLSLLDLNDAKQELDQFFEASPELGAKILNILLASSRLDSNVEAMVERWIGSFRTCPLYLAQVLKGIYPHLAPNLSVVEYSHRIFEFNTSLLPSARRVILETMLVEKGIVPQETFNKYKNKDWVHPPTLGRNMNCLLDKLMEIFQSKRMEQNIHEKKLLFEYISQIVAHGDGAKEHLLEFFRLKDFKNPEFEIRFLDDAVRNPSPISGIAPNDYQSVASWAKNKLSYRSEYREFVERQNSIKQNGWYGYYQPLRKSSSKSFRQKFIGFLPGCKSQNVQLPQKALLENNM